MDNLGAAIAFGTSVRVASRREADRFYFIYALPTKRRFTITQHLALALQRL